MSSVTSIPSDEGAYSPREAKAWTEAQILETNRAGDKEVAAKALAVAKSIIAENDESMTPLWRRWRATQYMLSGNTLDKGGPEDIHVPEVYKSIETIVPRIEEAIVERDIWFRVVPRHLADRRQAETMAAYYDWQYDQANVADTVQPAIRDMLVAQAGVWYAWWDNRESWRNVRTIIRAFNQEGRLLKTVKSERKQVIDYSGPRVKLVHPVHFIIHPTATNPQDAIYVGHRAMMTVDEIRKLGAQMGWKNLDQLDEKPAQQFTQLPDFYAYAWDPISRYRFGAQSNYKSDGRPEQIELVVIYTWLSLDNGASYQDYRIVIAAGRVVLDCIINPHDGWYRPYATACSQKTGHSFYSTGVYDNVIRMNQHLDRLHQVMMRGAHLAGQPMVFAEEDSEMPDSLYKVRPFEVFKGVGPVRFSSVPDGFLRSMPMAIQMVKRDIEEVCGSFRLNMGQDTNGTATEATLSLQEGNRRTRGLIRAFGGGLEQLLTLFHKLSLQFSSEDVEFPVLGKRALDLRRTHINMSPADLLDDVKFELVGLNSLRTQGLKATGLQAFTNAMTPFIMANPTSVDQVALMHDFASEMIGPEEADRYVKVPTPLDQLRSQEEENEGLITGTEIEVDPEDDHKDHKRKLEFLYQRAINPHSEMQFDVRRVVMNHWLGHDALEKQQQAQQQVMQKRQAMQSQMMPLQAGGQPGAPEAGGGSAPQRGGFSDAIAQLANEPGGQTPMENPGPADVRKYPRSGGGRRTTNQTNNSLGA
jgi:hypothetical protein